MRFCAVLGPVFVLLLGCPAEDEDQSPPQPTAAVPPREEAPAKAPAKAPPAADPIDGPVTPDGAGLIRGENDAVTCVSGVHELANAALNTKMVSPITASGTCNLRVKNSLLTSSAPVISVSDNAHVKVDFGTLGNEEGSWAFVINGNGKLTLNTVTISGPSVGRIDDNGVLVSRASTYPGTVVKTGNASIIDNGENSGPPGQWKVGL